MRKLTILVEKGDGFVEMPLEALYNPNQVALTKAANWCSEPAAGGDTTASQFTYGEPVTLTLDLFFDTYESGENVTTETDKIYYLTTVEKHGNLHRPPRCKLEWGRYKFGDFEWVVTNLVQTFTLFKSDGTPVRAKLSCSFRQWRSDEVEQRLLNKQSPDVAKTHVVQYGETLASIAAEKYDDPALWRPIAEANGLDNPRRLEPGTALAIPVLATGSVSQR